MKKINKCLKSSLLKLAGHFKVTEAKSAMKKNEIKEILVEFLIDKELLPESV